MSWTSTACVVAGYKIPNEAWTYAMELIEDDYDSKGHWEDFFVDPDPLRGSSYGFFGKIIFELDEDCEPVAFDSIFYTQKDVDEVNEGFNALLAKWCADHNYSTSFKKYFMLYWT